LAGTYSHVIGFDDAPFTRGHRGDVAVVGAAFAGPRLEGVLITRVRRDGADATRSLRQAVEQSRFAAHTRLIMLQGIALAGFNVVDIHALHAALHIPVLVVARRRPDLASIRRALLESVPGGLRKWRLIERAGVMEAAGAVWMQRAGITAAAAERAIARFAVNGRIPEPLRTAHLIASGLGGGRSRQRV
jgi:endonuclease V-like protein UPF0215 family